MTLSPWQNKAPGPATGRLYNPLNFFAFAQVLLICCMRGSVVFLRAPLAAESTVYVYFPAQDSLSAFI